MGVLCCGVVWICRLAELRSFLRILSCLLYEKICEGGLEFIGFCLGVGLCYGPNRLGKLIVGFNIVITCIAALSI